MKNLFKASKNHYPMNRAIYLSNNRIRISHHMITIYGTSHVFLWKRNVAAIEITCNMATIKIINGLLMFVEGELSPASCELLQEVAEVICYSTGHPTGFNAERFCFAVGHICLFEEIESGLLRIGLRQWLPNEMTTVRWKRTEKDISRNWERISDAITNVLKVNEVKCRMWQINQMP